MLFISVMVNMMSYGENAAPIRLLSLVTMEGVQATRFAAMEIKKICFNKVNFTLIIHQ